MTTTTRTSEPKLLIDVPAGFAGIPITGSGEQTRTTCDVSPSR